MERPGLSQQRGLNRERAKPAEGRTRRGSRVELMEATRRSEAAGLSQRRVEPMKTTGRSKAAGLSQQRVELMKATGQSEAMEQNERNHTEGVKQEKSH